MDRVPEPELMDDPEQALAYAQADFSEPHQAFVSSFAERFPQCIPRRVLDIGCGAADVTLRFARAYPDCHVIALDGAPSMIALAQASVTHAGLNDRIDILLRRLPSVDLPQRAFDVLISNSVLHHLADPMVLWDTVKAHGNRDANVFMMDLLRPVSQAQAELFVEQYAGCEPGVLKKDFFNSLLAAYVPEEISEQLKRAGLLFQVKTVSDRHMVIYGCLS